MQRIFDFPVDGFWNIYTPALQSSSFCIYRLLNFSKFTSHHRKLTLSKIFVFVFNLLFILFLERDGQEEL